jgi:hypothetical protein
VRFFSSFTVAMCLLLATAGSAAAVTYGPVTMNVPVSVSAPSSGAGTYTINVTCSSPKTATYSGIAQTTNTPVSVSSGKVTYGPLTVAVPVFGGLQSGATVTCVLVVVPPPPLSLQQYYGGLTYDATKLTTQFVVP